MDSLSTAHRPKPACAEETSWLGTRFYFDWANYRTMLRLMRRDPPASRRWTRYFGFLIGVPVIAAIHAVFFALDPILFPSLRRTQVIAPTFCVGHARSGTTYLHRLMAADPQFSYALMYELFFPSLLEKRLLRLLFRVDSAVFGKRLRHRLDEIEERRFAPTDDMHKTGFFVPEEDDAFLTWSLCSGFWILMFPFMGELDFYYVDQWPERKRRRAMELLQGMRPAPDRGQWRGDASEQEPHLLRSRRSIDRDVSGREIHCADA